MHIKKSFPATLYWILSNTSWLTLERIIYLLSVTYTSILSIKYIGPYYYGIISIFNNALLISLVISKFGSDAFFSREWKKAYSKYLIGNMILLRFFAGMILNTGIVLLSAVLGEIDVRCFYYILSISIAMMIQGTDITLIYNRANGFYRNDTMISIMTMMLTSLFKFIIVHYRLSFALLSIPIIFEALIPALYRQCSANAIKARFVIKKKIALYLIKHSVSYLFPSLSMLINQRAVFFILGIFNGQYLVGVYSVAFFISNAIFMLPNIITMTSLVKLNKISDYTERAEKAISTIRLITLLSLLIIVVSHFCGEYMIPKFLGEGYEKLNDIVTLIIFSFYVASVGVLSIKTLSKEECEGYYSVKYTLIIVLNIVLTVVLSLKYGIIGATCGFLFTEILSSTIANYLISKKIFYLHLKLFFNRS